MSSLIDTVGDASTNHSPALKEIGGFFGDIIGASGRSNELVNAISKLQGALGIVTAFILLGVMVWDVCASNTPVLTTTWVTLGSAGVGFAADSLAGSAIAAGLTAAGVTDTVAAGVALIGGIAASFILVAVVAPLLGSLFDLMVKAFSLHIPAELRSSVITVLKVLHTELSTPLQLFNLAMKLVHLRHQDRM